MHGDSQAEQRRDVTLGAAAGTAPVILARGLAHLYDDVRGLKGLDLAVGRGECMALLGHNGSGKTTALECVAGLLHPTAGWVRIAGVDPLREPEAIAARRSLAFVGDAPVFYRDFTVAEHLELVGACHGVVERLGHTAWESLVGALVDEFDLGAYRDALPHQLSAGLRQRVQLTCAFARPFDALALDEPSLRLDPAGQRLLASRIRAVTADGGAVLVSTHVPEFAGAVADRFVILEDGAVAAAGDWAEVEGGAAARRLGLTT